MTHASDGRGLRVVVVGTGQAGLNAAAAVRAEGFAGRVTLLGEEPGAYYDRPALSKSGLRPGAAAAPVPVVAAALADVDRIVARAADLDLGAGRVLLADGRTVPYDGLVVASGAHAVRPGFEGADAALTLRSRRDAAAIRARLAAGAGRVLVIGAGFIGTEVAAACAQQGCSVTVVDPVPRPLVAACGVPAADELADVHRRAGVRWYRAAVARIDRGPDGVHRVELTDGRMVPADVVVAGLGARPAVRWLAGARLPVGDGLLADETCLVAPGVVAAGDVCNWPSRLFGTRVRSEHWTNAVEQGEHAGRRLVAALLDRPAQVYDRIPYLWTEQFGHLLQVIGRPEPADEVRVLADAGGERRFVALHQRRGVLRAVSGMNWPGRVRRSAAFVAAAATLSEALAAAGPGATR